MTTLLLLGLLALNLFVSWWNCRVAGAVWDEARQSGGWPRFLCWCAVTQSAIGFSGIYLLLLAALGLVSGLVPEKAATAATHIWYLAVILPALGTGFAITVESWRAAIRDGGVLNTLGAGYNTGAMLHNAYQASSGVGNSLGWLGELLDGDSEDEGGKLFLIGLLVALCALFGGAITTWLLVGRYAREERGRRALDAAVAEARADVRLNGTIPFEGPGGVKEWLQSWGKENELPPPVPRRV